MSNFAADYVEVHERIAEFYERYPEGSLQGSWRWELDGALIVYEARAFRSPDDARPGVGWAQETYPGRTPYTKGSELMNAETSAWGRAIAALGIATKRGIATGHEVRAAKARNSQAPQAAPNARNAQPSQPLADALKTAETADLGALRGLWADWHTRPEWPQVEKAIEARRTQLEAADASE